MLTLEILLEANEWWKTGMIKRHDSLKYKRKLFFEIQKYINLRQIIAFVGLRRVGKTTLLYQLIELLLDKKVKPEHILYFSFDESVEDLREIITIYQENILKKQLSDDKIYIFLDEIQKLKDWQNKLKIYYDRYPNVKFFISGSASINLLLDAKESLAGRIFYFSLDVLSFEEFLEFKGKDVKKIRSNINLWKSELKTELNNFLLRPFPEIVNFEEELAKKYIKEGIIEKAIFRDLSYLFGIKDIELIEKLIYIIASTPGLIINLDDFSKDFGRSRQLISNYLYYLETCFLVKSLKNFKGSFKASSRKLKKYYLIHPAISLALSSPEKGKIIETLIRSSLHANYFWRELGNEVDFVLKSDKKIIPFESKYSKEVRLKDVKGLIKFMEQFKINEGIVITPDFESKQSVGNKSIKFIPLWKWILFENNNYD